MDLLELFRSSRVTECYLPGYDVTFHHEPLKASHILKMQSIEKEDELEGVKALLEYIGLELIRTSQGEPYFTAATINTLTDAPLEYQKAIIDGVQESIAKAGQEAEKKSHQANMNG